MFFVGKINLIFYIWALLVLSIIISHVYAHGGVDDEHDEGGGGGQTAPSVFASDDSKKGTLASGNVSLGFGLTVMAALASALGSLTPFLDVLFSYIPFLAHIKITESKGFIAGSLAFSSGILLSLTLGDLFPEAISSFRTSRLFDKKFSAIVATSIFIFTALLIIISKHLIKKFRKKRNNQSDDETLTQSVTEVHEKRATGSEGSEGSDQIINVEDDIIDSKRAKRFKNLGIQVAVALAIHNFPEGLATFATTIKDSNIGIIFAIGLALHKIPEGLIISLPIYCATGSRWIAFAIAATAGIISQILGAVLGYVLFVTVWNDAVSGVLFSIVVACLLYAILHGMLPMAHHYDPKDKYVTNYIFAGLFFFAIVSALFSIAEG